MAEERGAAGELQPKGEPLRKALRWLDDAAKGDPRRARVALVSEAAVRFDLTPLEEDFLLRSWVRGE